MIRTDFIINYDRANEELEELIIFLIFVCNKPANRTAMLLERFLKGNLHRPFGHIRDLIRKNKLEEKLRLFRVGQYSRITKSLTELTNNYTGAQLRSVIPEELEQIHGIGMKSSRCFVCWTQKGARYAMLDTHILKFLREHLKLEAPKGTPAKKKYLELEKIFLAHADKKKINPTELDLAIWMAYRI